MGSVPDRHHDVPPKLALRHHLEVFEDPEERPRGQLGLGLGLGLGVGLKSVPGARVTKKLNGIKVNFM